MAEEEATQDGWVVRTEGLTKQFGDEAAVDELTFHVPRGRIFGLIGPSGCGKTTTVRLLTGIYQPTRGQAVVLGSEPSHFSRAIRAQIGYMPQGSVLYPTLSVWENLRFAGSIYGVSPFEKRRLLEVLEFVELEEHRHKQVRDISGGMRRRLSLAACLIHGPSLLFLDEPTGGVDPVLRRKFWDHFEALREEGNTLLVTTQYMGEAAYCDLVGVMMAGTIVVVDTPEGLRRRAFEGEVINVRTKESLDYSVFQVLREIEGVRQVIAIDDTRVRLVADEASVVIPRIMDWEKGREVEVESVEKYQPPFDDVFVRLVERETGRDQGEWGDDG